METTLKDRSLSQQRTQLARKRKTPLASLLLRRLLNPLHWWRIIKLERNHKKLATLEQDSQLQFYSEFLPSGFMHYGYFDDPSIAPEQISLAQMEQAQYAYADKLLNLLGETGAPVLDAGCGMGGLLPLLENRGYSPVALTPDKHQAAWIKRHYPQVPLEHLRFEDLPVERYRQHFSAVITSESFQYMRLEKSMAHIRKILQPGGRWVICDYFRLDADCQTSGHLWSDFMKAAQTHGLKLVHEEDITPHILPTLHFAQLLADRFVYPVRNLFVNKISNKHPGYRYALDDVIEEVDQRLQRAQTSIDPARFAKEKQYLLLALQA